MITIFSVVEDPQVAGHDLVLQHGPGGDVYPVTVDSDDDHRAPQTHLAIIFSKRGNIFQLKYIHLLELLTIIREVSHYPKKARELTANILYILPDLSNLGRGCLYIT